MRYDYTNLINAADRQITKFGAAATLRQTADSGVAWNPAQADTDYTVEACFFDYMNSKIDGTNIHVGDRKVYVKAKDLAVVPVVKDRLIAADGTNYGIINIKLINPPHTDSDTVYYEIQARV